MAYTRVNWENLPSTNTPVNASNLNKIETAIEALAGATNLSRKATPLDYTTNFNDITEDGYYIYNGYSGSDTGSNRPTDTKNMGFLIVMTHPSWSNKIQIFYSFNSTIGMIYRGYNDGAWRTWTSFTSSYSTTEQRIGTWIDGKTLYRKVITGTTTNTTNGTWGYTEIDLNIANRKDFWIKTAFYYDSYGDSLAIPYTTNSGYIIKAMLLNDNKLRIITNSSDFNSLKFIVIIEYTKTTD